MCVCVCVCLCVYIYIYMCVCMYMCVYELYIYNPGQKYNTTLKNDRKDIVYNF